jgi:hypothetical protein
LRAKDTEVAKQRLFAEESPSWSDELWEKYWEDARLLVSEQGLRYMDALENDLRQLKGAVLNLERREIPRVWERGRRRTYEVSLLECFAVRIGRVRVELDHNNTDLWRLLLEREKVVDARA